MANSYNNIIILLLFTSSIFSISNARLLASNSNTTLMARLKLEKAGETNCWGSLFQLQACTGEIILFFMNGETYLGPGCCRAIKTVERDCWPTMLNYFGYTKEEGYVLEGYCDASDGANQPPAGVPLHGVVP